MKKKRYIKYASGGSTDTPWATQATQGLALIGQVADTIDTPNQYGNQSTGTMAAKNAANFAALGTAIAPGIGTAIGAIAGAGYGLIQGAEARKQERNQKIYNDMEDTRMWQEQSAARVGADPSLITGTGTEYYTNGGQMNVQSTMKAVGGYLKPMSQESSEVVGPPHASGGVDLPDANAEVEGDETIHMGYVFSDQLGFADRHKTIAKAIGKIETKPRTPERLNSLNRLVRQQHDLKLEQELIKNLYK